MLYSLDCLLRLPSSELDMPSNGFSVCLRFGVELRSSCSRAGVLDSRVLVNKVCTSSESIKAVLGSINTFGKLLRLRDSLLSCGFCKNSAC